MVEVEPTRLSHRARRTIALMGLALSGLVAGVAAYLWSSAPHPYSGPPPPATSMPVPVSMQWRSASDGWIVSHDAGGPESFLFHTIDGGKHWQRQLSTNGPASVRFTDARHGTLFLRSFSSSVAPQELRTDDRGSHWVPVTLPDLEPGTTSSPFFLDRDMGWVLAVNTVPVSRTALYGTVDGGQHWRRLVDVGDGPAQCQGISSSDVLFDLAFVAGGLGWLTGRTTTGGPALLMTRDGGREWARETLPADSTGPREAARLDVWAPTIFAGGHGVLPVYDRDGSQTWLYVTDDHGANWSDPRALPWDGGYRRPAFAGEGAGWTWSGTSAWLSADTGRTWRPVAALPAGWVFDAIAAVSATTAWASAAEFREQGSPRPPHWGLFRTTDAGLHWSAVAMPALA